MYAGPEFGSKGFVASDLSARYFFHSCTNEGLLRAVQMRSTPQQRDAGPGRALESLLRHRATFLAGLKTTGTGNMEDYHFPRIRQRLYRLLNG